METRLRTALLHDVDDLVALRVLMFQEMGIDVADVDWRAAAGAWFTRAIAVPDLVHVVVAVDEDDRPVACAVGQLRDECPSPVNPDGGSCLVHTVSVLPAFRRRGLARACMEELLDWVRREGDVTRLELLATPDGEGLYERLGFRRTASPMMRLDLPLD